jgi:predicted dehydrogenase
MSGATVGVVGLRRGLLLARRCSEAGLRETAVCETDPALLAAGALELGATPFGDFAALVASRPDALILANHFDEHAPLAIEALGAGIHVLSETAACTTLEEGRALIAAAEHAGRIYMFAENYPYKPHAFEIRRRFEAGEIGAFQYAECEYYHAFPPERLAAPRDRGHWRGRISSTHYCTHSIAPVMALGPRFPVEVSAFEIGGGSIGEGLAVVMMIRFDDGHWMKSLNGFLQGEPAFEWSALRVHGTRGLLENLRQGDASRVRLRREAWASATGEVEDVVVEPPPLKDDVRMLRAFADAIRRGVPPRQDARFAVACSLAGVSGLESLRRGSAPVPIPIFRAGAR